MVLALLVILATLRLEPPAPTPEHFVAKLEVGMTEAQVEEVLKPASKDWATSIPDRGGAFQIWCRFADGRETVVEMGGFSAGFKARHIHPVRSASRWWGLSWKPTRGDFRAALKVARTQLEKDAAAGADLAKRYPTANELRAEPETRMAETLELPTRSGKSDSFGIRVSGIWLRHRMVAVDLLRGEQWEHRVYVDLEDQAVVPAHWEPNADDIARARQTADIELKDFIGRDEARSTLNVRALGRYDYGPTRRIIVLCYEKRSRAGKEVRFREVQVGDPKDLETNKK